jgi:hypothetical protein
MVLLTLTNSVLLQMMEYKRDFVFRRLALLSPLSCALPRQTIRVFNSKPSPTEVWRPNCNPKSLVYILV